MNFILKSCWNPRCERAMVRELAEKQAHPDVPPPERTTQFWLPGDPHLTNKKETKQRSLIEVAAKYSSTPAEKGTFRGIFGEILFLLIFFIIFRILRFVLWMKKCQMKIINYIAGITGLMFLVITVSSIIVVSVYQEKYHSDASWKEHLETILTMIMIPVLMVLFPFGFSVGLIVRSLKTTGKVELGKILVIWGYFIYNPTLFNMLILTIYSHLYAWMHNTFILGYSVSVVVAAFGLNSCKCVKDFLWHYEMPLEGFYYLAQKIFMVIFFMIHLILSFLYLSLILGNDKGRPVKMSEFVFIYILTVASSFRDWDRSKVLGPADWHWV